ncbi:MAG: hypothetical protein AB7K04_10105 [Pseudorhodoplanes sp.]
MLPGLRFVLAGLFLTVVLPLIAFGVAGSLRNANSTALMPPARQTSGPGLAEYFWTQLYAPSRVPVETVRAKENPDADAAQAQAGNPAAAENVAPAEAAIENANPALSSSASPSPVQTEMSETPALDRAGRNDTERDAGDRDAVRDVVMVARLPDAPSEARPEPLAAQPVIPAEESPIPPQPAMTEEPQPAQPADHLRIAARDFSPEPEDGAPANPILGHIPLPPKRPAVTAPRRPSTVAGIRARRARSLAPVQSDRPTEFLRPLPGGLFESLFGRIGG